MFGDHLDISEQRIKPRSLLAKQIKYLIRSLMRKSYREAKHRYVLQFIFQIVFDELQNNFREDNTATTLSFMVSETIHGSGLKKDHPLVEKLQEIVD